MMSEEKKEAVNHPSHYQAGEPCQCDTTRQLNPDWCITHNQSVWHCITTLEVINIIEAYKLGFALGNTIKYILRADKKGNRLQDLRKALWYLNREIQNIEKGKIND